MSLADFPSWALFATILVLTVLSAYFSSSETAMMALNRYRLRHLVKQGNLAAQKANRLLRRPDRLLGVILIGNNFVNFLAASIGTVIGLRLFGDSGVVLAPVAMTIFFLIFAEVTPKTIAAHTPERLAFFSVYILDPLLKALRPLVWFTNTISNALVRPFVRSPEPPGGAPLTADELRTVVGESARIPGQHQDMLLGVLDLEHVTVNDIMVPRNEIVGIDIDDGMDDILALLANSQHTRLPVYRDNINNVLGMLHLRRLARHLSQGGLTRAELMRLTREPYYVPEATPLHTQLIKFKKEKRRIALVVDEYGDVQGIVTLEGHSRRDRRRVHDGLRRQHARDTRPAGRGLPDRRHGGTAGHQPRAGLGPADKRPEDAERADPGDPGNHPRGKSLPAGGRIPHRDAADRRQRRQALPGRPGLRGSLTRFGPVILVRAPGIPALSASSVGSWPR